MLIAIKWHYTECHGVSFTHSGENRIKLAYSEKRKNILLKNTLTFVILLIVIVMNVIILVVIVMSVALLIVIVISVIMLNDVAPILTSGLK